MHFGAWMREQRELQERTQAACAAAIGMKVQYWNHLEKHVGRPEMETVVLIARALNVPEAEALSAANYAAVQGLAEAETAEEKELIRLYRQTPTEKRPTFLRIVRSALEMAQTDTASAA